MRPIRVLLADDNATFRHGLRRLLESDARLLVVGEAEDGLRVVEMARTHAPDVILMDVRMPGQDGLAAARAIWACCPETKIIMLTSYDMPALRSEASETGVSAYLLKSVNAERLLEIVVRTPLQRPIAADTSTSGHDFFPNVKIGDSS